MKILRIRRGYTTNSSGANEWVPPKNLKLLSDAGPDGLSIKILTGQGASKWSPDAKQVTILATEPPAGRDENATEAQPATADVNAVKNASNLGLIGILVGAVCVVFGLTALVRRIVKKKK
jgi:hypothetical protein